MVERFLKQLQLPPIVAVSFVNVAWSAFVPASAEAIAAFQSENVASQPLHYPLLACRIEVIAGFLEENDDVIQGVLHFSDAVVSDLCCLHDPYFSLGISGTRVTWCR